MEAQILEEMGSLKASLHVYDQLKTSLEESDTLSQISVFFNQRQLIKRSIYINVEYWYLSGVLALAWEGLSKLLQTDIFADLLSIASLLKYAFEAKRLLEVTLLRSRKEQISSRIVEGTLLKIRGIVNKPERLKEA